MVARRAPLPARKDRERPYLYIISRTPHTFHRPCVPGAPVAAARRRPHAQTYRTMIRKAAQPAPMRVRRGARGQPMRRRFLLLLSSSFGGCWLWLLVVSCWWSNPHQSTIWEMLDLVTYARCKNIQQPQGFGGIRHQFTRCA